MTGAREFWVDLDHSCQMGDFAWSEIKEEAEKYGFNLIHLIEYSAYLEQQKRITKLESALDVARETLITMAGGCANLLTIEQACVDEAYKKESREALTKIKETLGE